MIEVFQQFPPILDKARFPLLSAGGELPCANLMGCDELTFFSADADAASLRSVILKVKEGMKWHQYGDTRWPNPSVWVEIDTTPGRFPGPTGILVLRCEIPSDSSDSLAWVARNTPLQSLFPDARSESWINEWLGMMRQQVAKTSDEPGPVDTTPRFVQCYCIYHGPGETRLVARYTDFLNSNGVPIPIYRIAQVNPIDIELCRFSLHALFRLNEARLSGMKFSSTPQLNTFEPVYLAESEKVPLWTQFHPMRVLRARPAVRSLPSPRTMMHGLMTQESVEQVMDVRRRESNLHNLAFNRVVRQSMPFVNDTNTTLGAFLHRANGGAIYSLPDQLVEEFDNTDCDEVQLNDIQLPFTNLFLKFTPPTPLILGDGAFVDGCYVVKQGEEYLFCLTSHWEGVAYERSLSVACPDATFSLHLPIPKENPNICINEAVELGIEAFFEENAPPTENLSRTITRPDGTTAFVDDIRAQSRQSRIEQFDEQEEVFRACLNIIVNAICFISFRPDDITEEWDQEPPTWVTEALKDTRDTRSARDRRQQAHRLLSTSNYTRIKVCGNNLFAGESHSRGPTTGDGVSPRAHWRRGHWRRQRHGPGLALVKNLWIRPTVVKRDNGTLVETRLYDVTQPEARPPKINAEKS